MSEISEENVLLLDAKPCPFCGNKETLCFYSDSAALPVVTVCCDFTTKGCGACSGYRDTKEEALEAWEMRV